MPKKNFFRSKILFFSLAVFVIILVTIVIMGWFTKTSSKPQYGISFSPKFATELGLDWKEVFAKTLDDLEVKKIRIPTYWDSIEKQPGNYDFSVIDYIIDEAGKRNSKVLLVVGLKQPRWPECHAPQWALKKSREVRREALLAYIEKTVKRYKDSEVVEAWQVENEPFFPFGLECDPPDFPFVKKEVELVKNLDPSRPVIVTDTGEWSMWVRAMKLSDTLGISLYRSAYITGWGFYRYPFPPGLYTLKNFLIRKIFAPQNQKTITAELQAEPWSPLSLTLTPIADQTSDFSLKNFQGNVEFFQKTGFDTAYLWGVEWWYWIASQGHPEYLEYAKSVFSQNESI